jgi:alcohol dehydrogenase
MSTASWAHYNPVRVIFRPGVLQHIADYVDTTRVALVTTPGFRRRGVVDAISNALGSRLIAIVDDVKPNPGVDDLQAQSARLRAEHPDTLIALGGGSTIDTAKALARLLSEAEGTSLMSLLREGATATAAAVPVVAIPTTAGTGAEVTPFGTVWDHDAKVKYSIAGEDLYPELAILDPELTRELPAEVTVASGLDAISHALESTTGDEVAAVVDAVACRGKRESRRYCGARGHDAGQHAGRSRHQPESYGAGALYLLPAHRHVRSTPWTGLQLYVASAARV